MNAIEVINLSYRYLDGTVALRELNFEIAAGECVALLGPNGSGKSTLLLHLNGILPENPSGYGGVNILGETISVKNLATIRREVGLAGFGQRATHHLSHGEKRRVCLAGVLACEPAILVLDEPTSDLDPRGRREFKALLRQIPATKVIATHDLELAVELCPRAIILDKGEIIANGKTTQLLDNEKLMMEHGLERPHILWHEHPHS